MGLHEMDRSISTARHRTTNGDAVTRALPDGRPFLEALRILLEGEATEIENGRVLRFLNDLFAGSRRYMHDLKGKLLGGDKGAWAYLLSVFAHEYDTGLLQELTALSPFRGHAIVCMHQPTVDGVQKVEMVGDAQEFCAALLRGRKPKTCTFTTEWPMRGGQILAVRTAPAKTRTPRPRE